jgi:tetratricopeptide (TPR) repeat protein
MPHDDLDERGLPARIASWVYGIALGLLFGWPFGVLFGASGVPLVLIVVASMFVAGYTIRRIMTVVPEGMARAFMHLIWPSGSSTPYEPTYSNLQALAARGDHAGALEAYDEAMRLRPMDPEPRFQAAELLSKSSTPQKAARLFIQARRLSGSSRSKELYATQRLIDLYLGKLDDRPRARAELRQLVKRFPGTREAEASQKLLDEISADLPKSEVSRL